MTLIRCVGHAAQRGRLGAEAKRLEAPAKDCSADQHVEHDRHAKGEEHSRGQPEHWRAPNRQEVLGQSIDVRALADDLGDPIKHVAGSERGDESRDPHELGNQPVAEPQAQAQREDR